MRRISLPHTQVLLPARPTLALQGFKACWKLQHRCPHVLATTIYGGEVWDVGSLLPNMWCCLMNKQVQNRFWSCIVALLTDF